VRAFVAGFASGVWWLQQQAVLPSLAIIGGLLLAAIVLGVGTLNKRQLPLKISKGAFVLAIGLATGLVLGIVWAAGFAHWRMADRLPAASEGIDINVTGVVAGLPQTLERGVRFEFDVEQADTPVPQHISLAWYRGRDDDDASVVVPVRAGERWQFTVRLKRPHGNMNPHGFDYEAWLFERGIGASGTVRPRAAAPPQRIEARVWQPGYAVEMLREVIRERFRTVFQNTAQAPYAGILIALSMGDQQAIDADLWLTFARSGITHLMSISGLHVTMFAGFVFLLCNALWRRSARLPLYLPARHAAVIGGFVAAFSYALLSGFAVPAQRTLYMLGVVAVAHLWRREVGASRVLMLALLLVLLLDPWAVLAAGFWLSFGAVALLLFIGNGRLGAGHWLAEWGRAQWAVTVGMLPALLALFQQFSLISPLANALAIPVVSFVITPLALLGALPWFDPVFDSVLWLAHWITVWLMRFIEFLAALPLATWQQAAPPAWAVVLALVGGLWLLLPRGFPARWLGALAFLPLLTTAPLRPEIGVAQVTVLDVGQGLAVHVQTATHDLLFDAGPAFSAEADSGNRIIVPYLRAAGVRHLDTLVVSHADKDHEGGAASVLALLPVALIRSSLPYEHPLSAYPVSQLPCHDGDRWAWDGVVFTMLHPQQDVARKTNDASCVLRIDAGGRRMLLTSDIEALSERSMLQRYSSDRRTELRADVMTAPHHGSRTSSTPEFIAAVGAADIIFPVGYRNSFRHPRPDIVERYVQSHASVHRTDYDGAVRVHLGRDGVTLAHERDNRRRYWHSKTQVTEPGGARHNGGLSSEPSS
jgi:competence protein ComEC